MVARFSQLLHMGGSEHRSKTLLLFNCSLYRLKFDMSVTAVQLHATAYGTSKLACMGICSIHPVILQYCHRYIT